MSYNWCKCDGNTDSCQRCGLLIPEEDTLCRRCENNEERMYLEADLWLRTRYIAACIIQAFVQKKLHDNTAQ